MKMLGQTARLMWKKHMNVEMWRGHHCQQSFQLKQITWIPQNPPQWNHACLQRTQQMIEMTWRQQTRLAILFTKLQALSNPGPNCIIHMFCTMVGRNHRHILCIMTWCQDGDHDGSSSERAYLGRMLWFQSFNERWKSEKHFVEGHFGSKGICIPYMYVYYKL